MKKTIVTVIVALSASLGCLAQVAPEELIKAVDAMTPEQARELRHTLGEKLAPSPRASFYIAPSMSKYNKTGVEEGVKFSADEPDVSKIMGLAIGFTCEVLPMVRIGPELGLNSVMDSDYKKDRGYSRATLQTVDGALVVQVKPMGFRHGSLWLDAAGGYGSAWLETLNTPSSENDSSTVREKSAGYWFVTPRLGAAWKLGRYAALFGTAGYRFAESVSMKQGGESTGPSFDSSGYEFRLGLGFNM